MGLQYSAITTQADRIQWAESRTNYTSRNPLKPAGRFALRNYPLHTVTPSVIVRP